MLPVYPRFISRRQLGFGKDPRDETLSLAHTFSLDREYIEHSLDAGKARIRSVVAAPKFAAQLVQPASDLANGGLPEIPRLAASFAGRRGHDRDDHDREGAYAEQPGTDLRDSQHRCARGEIIAARRVQSAD